MSKKELTKELEHCLVVIGQLELRVGQLESRNFALAGMRNDERSMKAFYRDCLGKILAWCAVDVVMQRTHRERNELYRSICRTISTWLKDISNDNLPPRDMDEIPL